MAIADPTSETQGNCRDQIPRKCGENLFTYVHFLEYAPNLVLVEHCRITTCSRVLRILEIHISADIARGLTFRGTPRRETYSLGLGRMSCPWAKSDGKSVAALASKSVDFADFPAVKISLIGNWWCLLANPRFPVHMGKRCNQDHISSARSHLLCGCSAQRLYFLEFTCQRAPCLLMLI